MSYDAEAVGGESGDRRPLQEVVRAALGAEVGHAAVRLDDPIATDEVEERGDAFALDAGEAQARSAGWGEERPDPLVVRRLRATKPARSAVW